VELSVSQRDSPRASMCFKGKIRHVLAVSLENRLFW
jgi:hypothetical protein